MSQIDSRLAELGITLPEAPAPIAAYVNCVRTGNLLFVSGGLPSENGAFITGKAGIDVDLDRARHASRLAIINRLAVLKQELGDLDRITRIVTVGGFVNSGPDFTDHPAVINGASELLVEIFGEKGRHSRTAVGVPSLPLGVCVEINLVVEVE